MKQSQWLGAILAVVMVVLLVSPALAIEARGKIKAIDRDNHEFTMITTDNKELKFRFKEDIKVKLDDKSGRLSDLKTGDTVTVNYTKDGDRLTVSDVTARRELAPGAGAIEAKGKIKAIDRDRSEFTMTTTDNKELKFSFKDDVRVKLNANAARLSDLKTDDEVSVVYTKDGDRLTVNEITARRGAGGAGAALEAKGRIKAIDRDKSVLTMTTDDNKELKFDFKEDVKVRLNRQDMRLSDLKVGDQVTVQYRRDGNRLSVSSIDATRKD